MATQAQIISENIKFVTNEKGERTEVIVSLKNKIMKEFFEDIQDLLLVQDRIDDEKVDFFESVDKILSSK
ncbi:hypothetical protein [Emticicia agri]|uniref:Uncharacterized protein n=1 Tax=Emticicia agri TaxID=2492393 RepID=A0A4Q5LX08_9BACT|nr:hypothetical protein [Emticicia agri]RYU94366.1 hypothetical protein EWM59_17125 [Emticicia agri]